MKQSFLVVCALLVGCDWFSGTSGDAGIARDTGTIHDAGTTPDMDARFGTDGGGPAMGEECVVDSDCASLLCSFGYCAPGGEVLIPAGTFTMGSPEGETGPGFGRPYETQHEVTITRDFWMMDHEVTQAEWMALSRGVNPSRFSACGATCPVEQVDWFSVVAYANALSTLAGLTPCYALPPCVDDISEWRGGQTGCATAAVTFSGLSCDGYRLPTESEWEYAYRAGTTTAFYNGGITASSDHELDPNLDAIGWYDYNSGNRTHPVRGKRPNAWGLYDMAGNVGEWTWDWWGTYPGTTSDPLGARSGTNRVYRGGNWDRPAIVERAAARPGAPPYSTCPCSGVRLVRTFVSSDDMDRDGVASVASGGTDCDDGDASIHPDAIEVCDGVDQNCDGTVDEGVATGCGGCGVLPHAIGEDCSAAADGSSSWQCDGGEASGMACVARALAPGGWVRIPAGTFTMGSPLTEVGRWEHVEDEHEVTITRDFWLMDHEVTQGEWTATTGGPSPSFFSTCGADCPVEQVSWWAVVAYANWLSRNDGDPATSACYRLTPATCADNISDWAGGAPACSDVTFVGLSCTGYRLPTESEFEYAYRAGTTTAFYNGPATRFDRDPNMDAIGWYQYNSGGMTHPVRGKLVNPWGLYDVAGNVYEWTWDLWGEFPRVAVTDPLGHATGSSRVVRGGSWLYEAARSRAAYTQSYEPDHISSGIGLRLARTAAP